LPIIQPEDTPQKVNNLLVARWGISLFKFAQVFAVSPVELFLQKTDYPFNYQEIKAIKHNLYKMRDDLLKRGRFILKITQRLKESPFKEMSDDELIKHMRLERFFKEYIHRHEIAMRYAEKICLQGKRGGGINKKSIIAVGWGNLVSEKSRRIDWEMLGDLYDWFWERVAPYKFYNKLKPSYGIVEDLRLQYNRHRWAGGAGNFLFDKLKIKKSEVTEFSSNFLFNQFIGGKENYLMDMLPITWDKFPKFFMNIIIDFSLTLFDGLALFSKDQSFADQGFLFLYIWQQKMAAKSIGPDLNKKSPSEVEIFKGAEIPYGASEIGDYFNYAIKLFLDHKVDLGNPPPLIIFPDKSYFSTSF
jgi:hypothetical protein